MSKRTRGLPIDDPRRVGHEPFTPEEAVAILCRVVARWAEEVGQDGDAVACRLAEHVLISGMRHRRNATLRAVPREAKAKATPAAGTEEGR